MRVQIWADITDPWGYIGVRRLLEATELLSFRASLEFSHHAVRVDTTPVTKGESLVDHLVQSRNYTHDEALLDIARVTASAAGDGIALRYDQAVPASSLTAHRALHLFSSEANRFAGYLDLSHVVLCDGFDLGDESAVVDRLRAIEDLPFEDALASNRFAREVEIEATTAADLGARAFPFVIIDAAHALQGPQTVDTWTDSLQNAWDASQPD